MSWTNNSVLGNDLNLKASPIKVTCLNVFGQCALPSEPRYASTTDSEVITGFITSETKTELTLALPEGKTRTIKVEDIEEREVAKQSSMPENLGGTIAPTEFLDLIEYMTTLK